MNLSIYSVFVWELGHEGLGSVRNCKEDSFVPIVCTALHVCTALLFVTFHLCGFTAGYF